VLCLRHPTGNRTASRYAEWNGLQWPLI